MTQGTEAGKGSAWGLRFRVSGSIPGAAALSSRIGGCPTHGLSLPKRLTHHRVEIGSSRRSGSLGAEGAEARTRLGKGRT